MTTNLSATRYDKEDLPVVVDPENSDFMARLRSTIPTDDDISLARQKYGVELPNDVIEQMARQMAVAKPILEEYHIMNENTPTLAIARATMMSEIDAVSDVVAGMDLTDLGDVGEFPDEYTCPRCAHRWSGAPNYRTGYGDKVYVPNGRVSSKTGRVGSTRYGPPVRSNKDFKFGRNWRGAKAENLPRGFGNRAIGVPIVGENWRGRSRKAR